MALLDVVKGQSQARPAQSRRAGLGDRPAGAVKRACNIVDSALQQGLKHVVAASLVTAMVVAPAHAAEAFLDVTAASPLADQSKMVPASRRAEVSDKLSALERDTGYRIRILTKVNYTKRDLDSARAVWGMDQNTALLVFDPTAPNVFGYDYIGDGVLLGPLRRPFWLELQARFGNMFYVRENGDNAALQAVVDTLDGCLRRGGCTRVPGLPDEQYFFTLALSIVGGIICGFSFRLEPNEVVSRRWFWPVLLSPLWASLFINFGLGPVVSRTDELRPVLQNTAAFLVAALLFRPNPIFFKEPSDTADGAE